MDKELKEIEQQLQKMSNSERPFDFIKQTEECFDNWSQENKSTKPSIHTSLTPWISFITILLLCSIISALIFQSPKGDMLAGIDPLTSQESEPFLPQNNAFKSHIKAVSNQIVSSHEDGSTHRVTRLRYEDEINLTDQEGRSIQIIKPRIQYYIIPIEIQ